jgi:hypothetical protein
MKALSVRATAVAKAIFPFRRVFLLAAIAQVALVGLVAWQSSRLSARTAFFVFGISFFGIVWAWGLFLLSSWFGPSRHLRTPFQILAVVVLLLWFVVGSIGAIAFTIGVLRDSGA